MLFLIFNFIYYYFLFLAALDLVAARGLSLVAVSGGYSVAALRLSHCGGFSCCGAWALGAQASVVAARRLSSCSVWASVVVAHGLSSCGTRA